MNNFLNHFSFNSPVTLFLFFISLIALIINFITNGKANKYIFSSYRSNLLNPFTYIRLITHIFGHQNFSHFSNNYMLILLIGPMIEEKYGMYNFIIMILLTALITGIINSIISKNAICGSSGIAFMMIVLSSFVNVIDNKIPITLVLIMLFYIVNEFILLPSRDNISHISHIIGAIVGIIFGFISTKMPLIEYINLLIK